MDSLHLHKSTGHPDGNKQITSQGHTQFFDFPANLFSGYTLDIIDPDLAYSFKTASDGAYTVVRLKTSIIPRSARFENNGDKITITSGNYLTYFDVVGSSIGGSFTGGTLTNKLTLASSTTANASINVPSGVAPSPFNSGDIFHDAGQKCFVTVVASRNQRINTALMTATGSGVVANSTTEASLIGVQNGSYTLPSFFWAVGKTMLVKARGIYSTDASSNTLNIRLKIGAVTIVSTGAITPPASATNKYFEIDLIVTCRAIGVSGSITAQGFLETLNGTIPAKYEMQNTTSVSLDTTLTNQNVDITATWSTANANNRAEVRVMTLEIIN
jgi:hypothetical protein